MRLTLKLSKSDTRIILDSIVSVIPYSRSGQVAPLQRVLEICEREELLFIASYHFAASVSEFKNLLKRDVGISANSRLAGYLSARWKKLFGDHKATVRMESFELLKRDGPGCAYCRVRTNNYEVHHVIPLARNGFNAPSNLVLTCLGCNRRISSNLEIPGIWWRLHPESQFNPAVRRAELVE
jgi:HNH endonuclease